MPYLTLFAHLALTPVLVGTAQTNPSEIVRESDALLRDAQTVQGSFIVVRSNKSQGRVDFVLQKPFNLLLRSPSKVDIFDGIEHVIVSPIKGTYERRNAEVYGTPFLIGFTSFLGTPPGRKVTVPSFGDGQFVTVGNQRYVRRTAGTGANAMSYDIDPATKLPARWTWSTAGETFVAAFQGVTLNAAVPAGSFDSVTATAGHRPVPTVEETALPAIGTVAPTIEGTTVQNRPFDLREYSTTRRAIIVAFVDPASQSSINSLASLGNLVRRTDLKDVGVVAISTADDPKVTRRFLRDAGFEPPTLVGSSAASVRNAFGVRLTPTFIVLDPAGTVRVRTIGYDPNAVLAALDARASG